jgi:hypothetical protein
MTPSQKNRKTAKKPLLNPHKTHKKLSKNTQKHSKNTLKNPPKSLINSQKTLQKSTKNPHKNPQEKQKVFLFHKNIIINVDIAMRKGGIHSLDQPHMCCPKVLHLIIY